MVAKIVIYLLFQKGTHKEKHALHKIFYLEFWEKRLQMITFF